MWRHVWGLAIAVGLILFLGCTSGEDVGEQASMDEMAAASTGQQSVQPGDTVTARPLAPANRPDTSLSTRRGFALNDLSNEAAYVLIKADAPRVAAALAKESNGTVVDDALGKSPDEDEGGVIVFQLKGHPWSIFALWPDEEFKDSAAELSKELAADVLTFANSDFSGWSFVNLYRGGEEIEALHWGEDLTESGLAGPDLSEWDTHTKITTDHGDDVVITDQWLFRSKLRKVSEPDLQQGEAFNDELFKQHDAYLPDAEDMPWVGENGIESPLGAEAFDEVQLIEMPETE